MFAGGFMGVGTNKAEMRGSKHGKAGEGGGEAAPVPPLASSLASQLQQAWLHTQLAKDPKRSSLSDKSSSHSVSASPSRGTLPVSGSLSPVSGQRRPLISSGFDASGVSKEGLSAISGQRRPLISSGFDASGVSTEAIGSFSPVSGQRRPLISSGFDASGVSTEAIGSFSPVSGQRRPLISSGFDASGVSTEAIGSFSPVSGQRRPLISSGFDASGVSTEVIGSFSAISGQRRPLISSGLDASAVSTEAIGSFSPVSGQRRPLISSGFDSSGVSTEVIGSFSPVSGQRRPLISSGFDASGVSTEAIGSFSPVSGQRRPLSSGFDVSGGSTEAIGSFSAVPGQRRPLISLGFDASGVSTEVIRSLSEISGQRRPLISSVFDASGVSTEVQSSGPSVGTLSPGPFSPPASGLAGKLKGTAEVRSLSSKYVNNSTTPSFALTSERSLSLPSSIRFVDSGAQQDLSSSLDIPATPPGSSSDLDHGEAEAVLSFLNDLLMDEDLEDKKCMFMECSAFQAMENELANLIKEPPTGSSNSSGSSNKESLRDGSDSTDSVDSWVNSIISGPQPSEFIERATDDLIYEYSYALMNECLSAPLTAVSVSSNLGMNVAYSPRGGMEPNVAFSLPGGGAQVLGSMDNGWHLPQLGGRVKKHISLSEFCVENGTGAKAPPVDLPDLLLRCAQAVGQNDVRQANELIAELRQHSGPYGNGPQRMAHYFVEALVAKMSGIGGELYTALSNNRPSAAEMLKAFRLFVDQCPFVKIGHIFCAKAIKEAFKGATRVHVIDYGILYGVQWPCLIQSLAMRPEGPPHLRITGIDHPQPGLKPSGRVQETGRRLEEFAKLWGVPFEYHALADKWETITPAQLGLRHDEVLAVSCAFRLRHLLDETVMAASPRKIVLSRIRSMNPKVFVQGVVNGGYNAPFFMSRFRESLKYYTALFDAMESTMPAEHPNRVLLEQEIYGREILNIVACEGMERVERAEPYRQWQSRTARAGFTQKRMNLNMMARVRGMMGSYHRDFGIGEDGGWFLLGWKNQVLNALTIWEPTPGIC